MARILFATFPVPGHVAPMIPLCRALVARGHDVAWYTGRTQQQLVVSAGARFFGFRKAREFDPMDLDASFPERSKLEGIKQLEFDLKEGFIGMAPTQCEDLELITRSFPADVIISDPGMYGALFAQEKLGIPVVMMGIMPMILSSVDTAPFGLGIHPSSGLFGRLRNRALNWLMQHVVFGGVQRHWTETRASIGLAPTGWFMDHWTHAAAYLQPSVPGFEYPRSDLAESVSFIGMMPPERPKGVTLPDWWDELDGPRPVVHVTQGTVANTTPDLIGPALEALENEYVLVVVSTGNRPLKDLGIDRIPENVRIAPYLSYPDLLPKTAAVLTNGGYGGVQMALSCGVPVAVAGRTEDKPEVAARVAWSGAGIDLKTAKPTVAAVRTAVRRLLDDPRYKARARELSAEYSRYDAVARALECVEKASAQRTLDGLSVRRAGSRADV